MNQYLSRGQALMWAIITTVFYVLLFDFISDVPLIGFLFVWVGWLVPVALWYTVITGE